jgi:hypothetical protein
VFLGLKTIKLKIFFFAEQQNLSQQFPTRLKISNAPQNIAASA